MKKGYRSLGWSVIGEGSAIIENTFHMGTEDAVVTAQWEPLTYTIKYETNGGTINSGKITSYTIETGATLPKDVTKEGYKFVGWYDNSGCTGTPVTQIGIGNTENKTFYAKWTKDQEVIGGSYTVIHNTNGGSQIADKTVSIGTAPGANGAIPTPTRQGYIFDGWYLESTYETRITQYDSIGGSEGQTITIYAKWTKVANANYKVEHYIQNTDLTTYKLKDIESTLTGPIGSTVNAVAKDYPGFTLVTTVNTIASGTIVEDGRLVLRLYYNRNKYTITLNTNEGTIDEGNITEYTYGIRAILPSKVTKEGYTFGGWYENENLMGNAIAQITEGDMGDKTYYVKWNEKGNTPYKVLHYKQTITGYKLEEIEELTGKIGANITAIPKVYEGYVENVTHKERVSNGIIVEDGSLELKLYYDALNDEEIQSYAKYIVKHYKQVGTTLEYELAEVEELIGKIGEEVTAKAKIYEGFIENINVPQRVDTGIVLEDGSLELKLLYSRVMYTVIFKDGDKIIGTQKVEYGGTVQPPILTKPGYILSWDKDINSIMQDQTITAVWTKDPNYKDPNTGNNNNNINNNKDDGKEEKPSILPQTGEETITLGAIIILLGIAVTYFIKYKF